MVESGKEGADRRARRRGRGEVTRTDGSRARRGRLRGSRPPGAPRRAPLPSVPRAALPALPIRLLLIFRTEMGITTPGASRNKTQRRARGGPRGGEGPGTRSARAAPRSLPPSRPHSPAPESALSPPPALLGRLRTAAAPHSACSVSPGKTCSSYDSSARPPGPSRGIGAEKPQPPLPPPSHLRVQDYNSQQVARKERPRQRRLTRHKKA
nr:serine/arginine repetitive matrix protein 1-like [Loxodonta africana]